MMFQTVAGAERAFSWRGRQMALSLSGTLALAPSYEPAADHQNLDLSARLAGAWGKASFYRTEGNVSWMSYPDLPAVSGLEYRLLTEAGRSFQSGRSLLLKLQGAAKTYDLSGADAFKVSARIQAAHSLGSTTGLSAYIGAGRVVRSTLTDETRVVLSDVLVESFVFHEAETGLRLKSMLQNDRFILAGGLTERYYLEGERQDEVRSLSFTWTHWLGNQGVGLSLNPEWEQILSNRSGESVDFIRLQLRVEY